VCGIYDLLQNKGGWRVLVALLLGSEEPQGAKESADKHGHKHGYDDCDSINNGCVDD
jgi:hypothetical protein